ncbi:hypothetical protein TIFTF001_052405 [Ficus carica]|uniref:Uncharacterized protein n=1 Tax=Ficus carica TaxID=3494 RepID=A0AA88EGN3_FICCA|nr:hypothetical protein TIFTF001_052405 [Ficus carica]
MIVGSSFSVKEKAWWRWRRSFCWSEGKKRKKKAWSESLWRGLRIFDGVGGGAGGGGGGFGETLLGEGRTKKKKEEECEEEEAAEKRNLFFVF